MNEVKELVEELRNKKSRDNRDLLDKSADMIERLAKELCNKSGCHHKCNDTTDCVVEDEAKEVIANSATTIEKQIEEIVEIFVADCNGGAKCDDCKYRAFEFGECIARDRAEYLYNAGYRKQSEGEWIDKPTGAYRRMQSWCSACGKHSGIGGIESNRHKPFCPNCGAKMKGGE